MKIEDTQQWALGRAGELQVKAWLQSHGCGVIDLASIRSMIGAPSVEGDGYRVVLPDFQVVERGISRYVEVKTKSKPTFHRQTRVWEHGIESRLFDQYRQVSKASGLPVWLCVFEVERSVVMLADTVRLEQTGRVYSGPKAPKGQPFIYWPCDEFDWYRHPFDSLTPIEATSIRTIEQPTAPANRGARQCGLF